MPDTQAASAASRSLQLQLALEAGQLGVWEWDRRTGRVIWSAELERLAGLEPGTFDGSFESYMATIHPDDRAAVAATIDHGVEAGSHVTEHRFLRPDGSITWVEGRGAVLRDEDGEVIGMVGVSIDVTDRVRYRRQLEAQQPILVALNRISLQLNREHDRDRLAETIVEVTAQSCGRGAAALVSRASVLHPWQVAAQHGDFVPDLLAIARSVAAHLAEIGASLPEVVWLEGALAVPVTPLSGLTDLLVVSDDDGAPEGLEALLAGIGAHAASALQSARLHEQARAELDARNRALAERDEVARQLQRSLLPPALPTVPGLDLAAGYLPMTEGIGGDFYDVYPLGDAGWGIVLGDVCGKGPATAGVTALARHTVRASAMAGHPPDESVQILNQAMIGGEDEARTFCTLVDARLQPHDGGVRIVAGVAGHPPILILRAGGILEAVGPTGHLVGMFDEISASVVTAELGRGDLCVLYTDGATDVRRDGGEVFGDERLADVVRSCRSMSAAAVVRSIELAVVDFQRGEISDDLAVVVVRIPD